MKLLQNGDNGGPCPFFWQESLVLVKRDALLIFFKVFSKAPYIYPTL